LVAAGERKEKRERSLSKGQTKKKEGEMREIFLNFKPCHGESSHRPHPPPTSDSPAGMTAVDPSRWNPIVEEDSIILLCPLHTYLHAALG